MNKYSEIIGSFIRTGDFPIEADYIFSSEQALKEYYSDPVNKATLHKGLLKVVEDDGEGNQALYWVTPGEDKELGFTKVISNLSIENLDKQLNELLTQLNQEIQNRKDADRAIWGTNDPSSLPESLNSIYDLVNAVQSLQGQIEDIKSYQEVIKAIVGTEEEDIIEYLKTLSYKSITELSQALEAIMGNPLPSEEFNSFRKVEEFVRTFQQWTKDRTNNLQSELDQTQIGVGLSGDGSFSPDKETIYLQDATSVMNALKILDSLVDKALKMSPTNLSDFWEVLQEEE